METIHSMSEHLSPEAFDINQHESILSFFRNVFSADFMPHGHCYWWKPDILWLHAISDFTIGVSYFAIAAMLFYLVKRKSRSLPFQGIFNLFGAFILCCGATHFLSIVTLWIPVYRLEGLAKAITAAISLGTAYLLIPILPKALRMKSNEEFELKAKELETVKAELEILVAEKSSKLGKTEGLLQAILDHSPSPIWIKDQDGKFVRVNHALEEGWGIARGSLIGKTDHALYPDRPDLASTIINTDKEVLQSRRAVQREEKVIQKGEERIFLSVKFPIPVDGGSEFAIGGIGIDVTERKKAQLLATRMRNALENAAVGLAVTEPTGRFIEVNPAYCKITGYTQEELTHMRFHELNHPEDLQNNLVQVRDLLDGLVPSFVAERRYFRKDRKIVNVRISVSVARDELGNPHSLVALAEDVTERKQAEADLKEKTVSLENSNAELAQFAFVASHDLKEPLRTVANYSQMLQRLYQDSPHENADVFVQHINDAVKRIYALLNDLLDFSKVGAQSLNFERVNCEKILGFALANLDISIQENRATISYQTLPEVLGDEIQLVQLFQNLIANAVKYRKPDQSPQIQISVQEAAKNWTFRVQDNGIGIEPRYFEKIFVLFQRLHGRDQYSGTGIGLSVCKRIIERHGGTIGVESVPGEGSAFFFTLPKL
jgi:PAS domain S-box-containing protein